MKKIIMVLCFTIAISSLSFAESVKAYVSNNKIGTDDTLTFTIEGENLDGDLNIVSSLNFPGFTIVSGPNRSHSISIVNGSMSKKDSLSFVLAPEREGKFTIPSFTVKAGDKEYKTKPIEIEVVKGSIVPHQRNRGNAYDPFDNFFDDDFFAPPRPRNVRPEDIFIRTEVSKKKVYLGEPILVKFRLFTTVPITQLGLQEAPSFEGFLAYDIDANKRIRFQSTVLAGKRYNTAIIYKKVLYPTKSGELVIKPLSFVLNAQADFFFGKRVIRKSEPLRIKVLPLPEPPKDFSGLVGSFDIHASVDTNNAKVGQSISFKVVVSGKGDLKALENIIPDTIDGFKIFKSSSPKITSKDPINQSKVWDIVLVPVREGKLEIPSIKLTYFDPLLEKYVTKETNPIEISVSGKVESGGTVNIVSPAEGNEVRVLNKDIAFIKTGKIDTTSYIVNSKALIIVSSVVPFLFIFWGIFVRIVDERRKNDVEYRKQKAYSFFKNKLKKARKFARKKNSKEFYQTLSKAVISYFSDKFSKPNIELRIDEIEQMLKEKGVDEKLIKQLTDFVEYCDFESYTPHSSGIKLELINEANEIIQKVEKAL
ncbi:aerotolerance-related exported protein BatD [Thermotomaculum hydrothermale]|uniref:Aerotolerance-related exported protein BatD n=1 Tax=Thermotomaculum hydrothermale TaxID=981385 RepID=A0A7R6PGP8_9BACT|nr:BatD family protein [Thermotomaculum hydrothermale]BBB32289.1 aerotolerance-related exported protein BatD [Thermotomaculum hydrothermale]